MKNTISKKEIMQKAKQYNATKPDYIPRLVVYKIKCNDCLEETEWRVVPEALFGFISWKHLLLNNHTGTVFFNFGEQEEYQVRVIPNKKYKAT